MREWIYDHVMLLASPVEVTTMKIKVILMHELPLPETFELYGKHTNPQTTGPAHD